jgi:hypothetical protein
MIRTSIVAMALGLLIFACNNSSQIENLQKEVMTIHDDEAMPRMSEISTLRRGLRSLLAEDESLDSLTVAEINVVIQQLEDANEAMMVWMREYNTSMDDMTDEQKLSYLQAELVSIKTVRDEMLASIAAGEAILKK